MKAIGYWTSDNSYYQAEWSDDGETWHKFGSGEGFKFLNFSGAELRIKHSGSAYQHTRIIKVTEFTTTVTEIVSRETIG